MRGGTDRDFPAFSPTRAQKGKKGKYDGMSMNGSRYGGQIKPKNYFSLWNFFMQLTTLGMILIAIGVCYLSQLDAAGQQQCIHEIKSNLMHIKERSIKIWNTVLNSPFSVATQIVTGKGLLKNHDPAGAEAMCNLATEQSPLDIDAWICLGESRLALHNSAWSSGLMENQDCLVFDKLNDARKNFETAVNLNHGAMTAASRLGFGLSLFLTATRRESSCGQSKGESTSQLLFDSILHLNAAASLTESSMPFRNGESHDERKRIHMVATYNTGLAHLALGDSSSAMSLFRKISISIDSVSLEGVSIPELNLMAALVQKGSKNEPISIFNDAASEICRNDNIYEYTSDKDENKAKKICAIAQNNLAVAMEANDDVSDGPYEAAIVFEKELHVQNGFVSLNHEQSHATDGTNFDSDSAKTAVVHNAKPLFKTEDPPTSDESSNIYNAILAFEDAARKDPNQCRQWTLLSKAKLQSGDRLGAVESGTTALKLAMDEVKMANNVLDEALQHNPEVVLVSTDLAPTDSFRVEINSEIFHSLKEEVLNLKLQFLQQSLMNANDFNDQTKGITPKNNVDRTTESSSMMVPSSNGEEKRIVKVDHKSDEEITQVNLPEIVEFPVGKTQHEEKDSEETADTANESTREEINDGKEEDKKEDNGADEKIPAHVIETVTYEEHDSDTRDDVPESAVEVSLDHEVEIVSVDDATVNTMNIADAEFTREEISENVEVASAIITEDEFEASDKIKVSDGVNTAINENNEQEAEIVDNEELQIRPEEVEEEIKLPELYNPTPIEPEDIPRTALSYMKMADAYLQKGNFKLASKQFLKVLKKAPTHIPASLGFASTLERYVNSKQLGDVVLAYVNVTKNALMQENKNLALASLRRALSVARDVEVDRIGILETLSAVAFTNEIAADVQYELGIEILKQQSIDPQYQNDAVSFFKIANEYMANVSEGGEGFHSKSLVQLGRIALDIEDNAEKSLSLLKNALSADLGELTVDALIISARSKQQLGDIEGAMQDYKNTVVIENEKSEITATAHFNLAVLMMEQNMNLAEIKEHMEIALNLGMDLNVSSK
jgi:tetratricopeptide (TPR) repeat protein